MASLARRPGRAGLCDEDGIAEMESKSLLPENAHSNSRFRPPWWMTLFLAIIVLAGICAYKGWSIQGYFDGWQAQPLVGQQKGTKPVGKRPLEWWGLGDGAAS